MDTISLPGGQWFYLLIHTTNFIEWNKGFKLSRDQSLLQNIRKQGTAFMIRLIKKFSKVS